MTFMICVWFSVGTGIAMTLVVVREIIVRLLHLRRLRRLRGSLERLLDTGRVVSTNDLREEELL